MSLEYDQYLAEHVGNVNVGLHWMMDNLPLNQAQMDAVTNATLTAHDESKFSKEEYEAYDKYFYGGNQSFEVKQAFDRAWLHHIHQNPHHWQYWVLLEDDPKTDLALQLAKVGTGEHRALLDVMPIKLLRIPLKYIFEMIADWWTFSWRNGNLFEIFTWYGEHRGKQFMHPESREIVEDILKKMWRVLVLTELRRGKDRDELERQYISYWIEEPVVEHSGVKGQKWGVQNGPPYPIRTDSDIHRMAKENMKGAVQHNVNDWGSDENHNILYISGKSGTGKSTVALSMKSDNDTVIHLDGYSEESTDIHSVQDKKFNKYLDEHIDNWQDIYMDKAKTKAGIKEYWHKVDEFNNAINAYAKQEYKNGNKVIVEGVQIDDQWLFNAPEEKLNGLPYISLRTDIDLARSRAQERDLKHSDTEDDEDLYGVPEFKKFPMPDKKHVKSAIRFFNYIDPKHERELAEAILEKAEDFGLDLERDISVGDENRFRKYLKKEDS